MKIALVHDWYYVNGGAEKVVRAINEIWPDISHYALIDFLSEKDRNDILKGKKVATSFIQCFPSVRQNHRKFLQLFPYAIERFDLSSYDVIISSSAAVAKGIRVNSNQLHICYCHSPMRYAYDLYDQYIQDYKKGSIKRAYVNFVLQRLRRWDQRTTPGVTHFVANSNNVAQRILRIYKRKAEVIFPPVDTDFYELSPFKGEYFFTASRMVSYKRMSIIIEAFNNRPDLELVIAGSGPEEKKLKKIAGQNVQFKGFVDSTHLKDLMQHARAFVYAAEEDFGIVPVEAMSCGVPVIAFAKGGLLETVKQKVSGLFFEEQSSKAVGRALEQFEKETFDPDQIREHALQFGTNSFKEKFEKFVMDKWQSFKSQ